jgi:hypothetical protein
MNLSDTIVALTAILIGGAILIIPLSILAVRYAAKPVIEAWRQARATSVAEERMPLLESRLSLLEQQVEMLERGNARLAEKAEFDAQIGVPR